MSLIVTGTIGIDTIHGPTGSAERVMGGSCAYFAAAASHHTRVRVVAAAGGDWPEDHRKQLGSFKNICLEGLQVRPNSQTFAWGGKYHEHMNERETLFTELGVLEEPPPPVPDQYRDSEYVFLANSHPEVQLEFLNHLPERKFTVADSMDLWINIARDELLELFSKIDGVIINDSEAELLTEMPNAVSAARMILDHGLTFVIVKKGEHGALLMHRDGTAVMPAYPADHHKVVDPTGAGDAFAGGFMGHIASNGDTGFEAVQTGLAWGTVTASFTIESFGLDRLANITHADIAERLDEFKRLTRVG